MFKAIKEFFTGKPAEVAPVVESAPYKVPEPAATTPTPLVAEVQPVVENKVDPVAVALDLEPVVIAEPAKKPRKPRAPKVAEAKPATPKKVATPKKAAAIKAKPKAKTAK
jgi:hypothetical protein